MIIHIVFFKLKPEVNDAGLEKMIADTREQLGAIEVVRDVQAGKNVEADPEWPFFLSVTLDSMEALDVYRVDPLHVSYLDTVIKPLTSDRKALDFELG